MSRGSGTPFWVRSIRRRPAASVVLTVLAVITTIVSVLAPLLLRAVEQATLDDALARGGVRSTSIAAAADIEVGGLAESQDAVVTTTGAAEHLRLWQDDVVSAETSAPVSFVAPAAASGSGTDSASGAAAVSGSAGVDRRTTPFAGYDGPCRRLGLTAGRCPEDKTEVVAAASAGLPIGTVLPLTLLDIPEQRFRVRVVGTYDATSGAGFVVAGPDRLFGSGGGGDPALVTSLAGFADLGISGRMWSARTLEPGTRLDQLPTVLSDVQAARDGTLTVGAAQSAVSVTQRIDTLVNRVADGNDAATVIVAVSALQAVIVAWFAQGVLAARVGRARAGEWGLARLRGLSARRRSTTVLLEPVVATLVGSAVGAVLGVLLAGVGTRLLLGADAPLPEPFRLPVLGALTASVLGSLVALLVASTRAARVPLVDLLRHATEPRTLSRTGAVVQAVAVIAALVGLAAVVTQRRIDGLGIALLAPTLVAVLVAVIGLRIGVAVVRRRAARPARSLVELLALRRISRTPSVLTTSVMVVMGVALAVSSSQSAVLAVRLADDRAAAELGAATVLDVGVREGVPFMDTVRRADPSGQMAMAVETTTTGAGVGRLVAVDSTRLAAVSAWQSSWGGEHFARAAAALRPAAGGPALRFRGDRLAVTLADVGKPDGTAAANIPTADPDDVDVVAVVQSGDAWNRVDLGAPRTGTLTSADGTVPCDDGCRLVWLGLETHSTDGTPYALGVTVTRIAVGSGDALRPVDAAWLTSERWRDRIGDSSLTSDRPMSIIGDARHGLRLSWIDPTGSGSPSIAPRDAPEPLPAVVGRGTVTEPFAGVRDGVLGVAPSGDSRVLGIVGRAPALPRVLGDGTLVDLGTAGLVSNTATADIHREVWLAPGSHPGVVAALERGGVIVQGRHTLADAEHRAERSAPARGALVGVPIALAALALTLLVVAGVGVVGAAARREDAATLRTAGFRRSADRRALFLETFLPAALAVVAGAVASTAATLLTAGRLPLRLGALPPMGNPVDVWTVVGITLAALAAVAAVSAATAAFATRPATPGARAPERDGGVR
jgi:hypothetical protein